MVAEVGVYGRDDGGGGRHAANEADEVDRGLERAGEEPGAGQEEVPDRCGGEVECAMWRPGALQDLEREVVQHASEELARRWSDRRPERRGAGDEGLEVEERNVG